jgi:hypothetical protein
MAGLREMLGEEAAEMIMERVFVKLEQLCSAPLHSMHVGWYLSRSAQTRREQVYCKVRLPDYTRFLCILAFVLGVLLQSRDQLVMKRSRHLETTVNTTAGNYNVREGK